MNNTSNNIGSTLLTASAQLNIWFGSLLWAIGNISCVGNIVIFRSRFYRKQAYAIYLFAAALSDFHYFNFVLVTRILQNGFLIPLMNNFTVICKIRQFSTVWGNVVGISLYAFATIDRILSTQRENKYRRWSNRTSLAYVMIVSIPLFWFLLLVHRLILYRIENGLCSPKEGFYSLYDNYFQVIFSSVSPVVVMSTLAYLLLNNVRRLVKRRIRPTNNALPTISQGRTMINQMDAQLTLTLVLQSLIAIIAYLPYAAQLTYANITQHWYKTTLRLAWEKLFTELIHLFSYVFFATTFYVSIISNMGYRRNIEKIFGTATHQSTTHATMTLPHT